MNIFIGSILFEKENPPLSEMRSGPMLNGFFTLSDKGKRKDEEEKKKEIKKMKYMQEETRREKREIEEYLLED